VESLSQVPDERGTLRSHDTRKNGRFEVPVPSIRLGGADPGSRVEGVFSYSHPDGLRGGRESIVIEAGEREIRYRGGRERVVIEVGEARASIFDFFSTLAPKLSLAV
jgi:hypothetical protein